jgi:plastocyanin
MSPEDRKDTHEGGYSPHIKTVGWAILVMGISLVLVIFAWLWIGYIGPSFSASVMAKQQADLRKQYGLPSQETSTAQLEVPPSLRGLENASGNAGNTTSQPTQSASTNATSSNQTAAVNQSAGNATASNQTKAAPSTGGTKVSIVQGAATKTIDAFNPNPIKIKAGGTVTWTNDDSMPHTVTSGKNSKPDGTFDSKTLAQGKIFSYKFEKVGEYSYYCQIHPNMVGTVGVS